MKQVHSRWPVLPARWAALAAGAALVLATLAVAGVVSQVKGRAAAGGQASQSVKAAVAPVRLAVSPRNGAGKVRLNAKVKVSAAKGTIKSVKVTAPKHSAVKGSLAGATWTSEAPLAPGTRYRVTVVAANAAGQTTRSVSSFTTLRPADELEASIAPLAGETVGVGMPITVSFNHPIRNKAAVERALEVTTSSNVVGAWHWFGSEEVRWRPKDFWPARERVSLHAALTGVDAGDGVWGIGDRTVKFGIGDSLVSTVSVSGHRMVVRRNGKVVRNMPASTGRSKYPTTNGIHTVLTKERSRIMDSRTVPNIPPDEAYRLEVFWAVRISNTGEFVHSAPWSVGAQGRANVSHGCVNLSPANATWYFGIAKRGDVVKVTGSPRQPGQTEGLIEWNRSWAEWKSGSALPASEVGVRKRQGPGSRSEAA